MKLEKRENKTVLIIDLKSGNIEIAFDDAVIKDASSSIQDNRAIKDIVEYARKTIGKIIAWGSLFSSLK